MNNTDFIKILIPAVGGQGGGILTDWLYNLFLESGYDVQTVSLPGLAQRTGSTVYYLEAYLKDGSAQKIIFSQHPVPGDIDLILSQEFLELGRILEQGFGSRKTGIISSTHRVYSTLEKLPVAKGIYSEEQLILIAEAFSSEFVGIDALEITKKNGLSEVAVNAVLFGILFESGFLPFEKSVYIESVKKSGIAVDQNLRAFELGCIGFHQRHDTRSGIKTDQLELTAGKLGVSLKERDINALEEKLAILDKEYPSHIVDLLSEALVRLTDYQDISYAEEYLETIRSVIQIENDNPDKDFRLSEIFLKNLALLKGYEDGIRVAKLKIRENRFNKIKEEMDVGDTQIFRVRDYLKPDAEEVYGLLPHFIVSPFLKLISFSGLNPKKPVSISQKPETTSFTGFLRLWLLSRLRFSRRKSYRFKRENINISKYVSQVKKYSGLDYELGCLVAMSGSIIKGYGKVRRRTVSTFNSFHDDILDFSIEEYGLNGSVPLVEKSLELISEDEKGIDEARKLVFETAV